MISHLQADKIYQLHFLPTVENLYTPELQKTLRDDQQDTKEA